jgi:hypothetical protein
MQYVFLFIYNNNLNYFLFQTNAFYLVDWDSELRGQACLNDSSCFNNNMVCVNNLCECDINNNYVWTNYSCGKSIL